MTDPIASEPAEPTTRQDPELWWSPTMGAIRKFGDNFRVYGGGGNYWGWFLAQDWPADAVRLVLADPAQTTELERLRARVEELTDFAGEQANARRESDRVRNLAAREAADVRDELATARSELAEKTEYAGEKAREGDVMSLEIDDLTAERDALSLLLRGMARKLVAYRKWTSGDDVPVVHRLRREAEERQARVAELEASVGHHATMRGDAVAQREMLKTRIDAALAECDREYPIGRVPIDEVPSSAQICDRIRAALVGDQPPAEEPKARCCIGPFADGTHAANCWQRCQDCGNDEGRCRCADAGPDEDQEKRAAADWPAESVDLPAPGDHS